MFATTPRKVFTTIQILRGVAALIVVFFHLTLGDELRGKPLIFGGFFVNGFAGVDLFFVISGFVIMHTSHKHFSTPAYWSTYLRKRFIRVYPIYWITLILIIGGIFFAEFISRQPIEFLPKTWPLYLSAFLLLPGHPMINGVTWSLSFELYYYLVFGLLIISRQLWPVIVIILLLSSVVLVNPMLVADQSVLITYIISPYNLEFASGVLAWWLIHKYSINTSIYIVLIGLAGSMLFIHDIILFPDVSKRVIYYGTSSFLFLMACTGLELKGWKNPSFLSQLLMKIGDASYLIYILHFPLLPFYGRMITPLLKNSFTQHISAILFVLFITAFSIDLHNRLEAPLVKKLNLLFDSLRTRPNPS